MGWFLFIDESGQDGKNSPYEVLAGLAVEDRKLWPLIKEIKKIQNDNFGMNLFDAYGSEAKGQKLLKKKVFKLSQQKAPIPKDERLTLAKAALQNGSSVQGDQLTALSQAKLAYVSDVLDACYRHGTVAFASIIPNNIEKHKGNFLRKDYSFLFERFFHHLEIEGNPIGTIVFDELDKSESQILVDQMYFYFSKTKKGIERSSLIIPEPLFVHSDLTTMIQSVDLIAYIISWGLRLTGGVRPMSLPKRDELDSFATQVCRLRYHHHNPTGYDTWGFAVIGDLRVAYEK
ncbi:hypothetical protein BJI49_10180 [Acetobacter pasteurianus]|uniref:DUF3800 domain-containing protein n=1 Tax=Acetobacter pasteurianus TaxID=438 RepID=UPI0002457AE7|nr:DUF3800 domain-containing protein [Acetobacter pasteurianus]RCL05631.1 hypothetical protein BJI49_10180 [Acetobacter pasteurianus]GAB31779.1 hypothetical protein APS_2381 [Acetobacter pasteurianus subsp. pasteurianus LMG 1262 = NBRC 106471]GCD50921.1 hypothetical protein NBRC106471_2477 [Acetobacter pasteurianus subsp. pasteurianus LMG 1262 = NBRC 106471]